MSDTLHIDLSNYSLAELRSLSADVARQIRAIEENMVADARRRIEQIAREAGLPLEELVANPRQKRVSTTLYVNPGDETQTWAGRGRKPSWLKAWLECSILLEELRSQAVTATHQEAQSSGKSH